METKPSTVIHFAAKNDTNGNPRRLFVGYSGDEIIAVWDEGYRGKPEAIKSHNPGRIEITPSEYKNLVGFAKESGFYHNS